MIYIFYFENFQNLYKIETGDNTKELIAINQSPKNTIIAYPSKKGGRITIKKIFSVRNIKRIKETFLSIYIFFKIIFKIF